MSIGSDLERLYEDIGHKFDRKAPNKGKELPTAYNLCDMVAGISQNHKGVVLDR